eukprot:1971553-Amphidinium_carterae.1
MNNLFGLYKAFSRTLVASADQCPSAMTSWCVGDDTEWSTLKLYNYMRLADLVAKQIECGELNRASQTRNRPKEPPKLMTH